MIAATTVRITDLLNQPQRSSAVVLIFSRVFPVALLCACSVLALSRATAGTDTALPVPAAAMSQAALLAKTLATLNLSSPIADLDANWDRKDHRFVGINSYSCMAPGIGGADTALPQRYGLRCLFGTSDFLESRAHAALMAEARRYAARYNAELARRIRRDQ